MAVAQGPARLAASLLGILSDEAASLSPRRLIEQLRDEWRGLDIRIAELNAEFKTVARQEETAADDHPRLRPGAAPTPVTATSSGGPSSRSRPKGHLFKDAAHRTAMERIASELATKMQQASAED